MFLKESGVELGPEGGDGGDSHRLTHRKGSSGRTISPPLNFLEVQFATQPPPAIMGKRKVGALEKVDADL
jgi:hypothetical protein